MGAEEVHFEGGVGTAGKGKSRWGLQWGLLSKQGTAWRHLAAVVGGAVQASEGLPTNSGPPPV